MAAEKNWRYLVECKAIIQGPAFNLPILRCGWRGYRKTNPMRTCPTCKKSEMYVVWENPPS